MTKLEDALRRALADQPPAGDAARVLARVERTLDRRHRLRSLGAAAAATVSVIALAGGGVWAAHQRPTSSPEPAATRAGVVPWINTPGTPAPAAGTAVSAPPVPSWPACDPAALRASYGSISAWAGTSGVSLVVANVGTRGCVLAGAPSAVVLVRPDGTTVRVNSRPVGAAGVLLHAPAALSPGQHAEFVLASSDMCPRSLDPTAGGFAAVRFRVASGPWMSVPAPTGGTIGLPCRRWFSGFGVRLHAPNPVKANPLHVLEVASTVPARVTAGQPLRYQVRLRNPTSHVVDLHPCPSYTEFLAPARVDPHRVERTYQLNCVGAGGRIPAHSTVVFAMRIPAPRAPGSAKFGWSIDTAGLATGRALDVVMPDAQSPSAATSIGRVTFASPTGNITCAMDARGASCDMARMNWPLTSADLASCHAVALAGLALADGRVTFDCRSDVAVPDPQRVLAYGQSVTTGPITCSSASTGMTCRDRRNGHGFFVSRDTFRRY